jgi:hypothetical protein
LLSSKLLLKILPIAENENCIKWDQRSITLSGKEYGKNIAGWIKYNKQLLD